MNWNELYDIENAPSFSDINKYIGSNSVLFQELCSYIEKNYSIKPKLSYSKCPAQPGWNIKYQKSGKSLCTLYPMTGFFIALVVIGAREEPETESCLETMEPYTAKLYMNTKFSCGGRWLMIEVKTENVLNDVKTLINIRKRFKK
ncbi:MAG: DUF3788 domain-containing protein [Candidatus Wallbacteria bacterium]